MFGELNVVEGDCLLVLLHVLHRVLLLLLRGHTDHLLLVGPHGELLTLSLLLLGHVRVVYDSQADISTLKGAYIIGTITAHESEVALLVEHAYDNSFLSRGRARKDVDMVDDRGGISQQDHGLQDITVNAKHFRP